MHLEFLVEEPSAEAALQIVVPRIVGDDVSFRIHAHQSKDDLKSSLLGRLRGYAAWLPDDGKVIVVIDEDRQDCRRLKAELVAAAERAGLARKVISRVAVEELEAWYFGDVDALRAAYAGIPPTLAAKAPYRDPDAIVGGTWEALERLLQRHGYHLGGLQKIKAARDIAPHMNPARNRSRSFQVFRDAVITAVEA